MLLLIELNVFYLILVLVCKFLCLVVSDFSLVYMHMFSCVLSIMKLNEYVMLCYV